MKTDYEIAIVGGGPAGAATALFLCNIAPALAERVLLIDRATFPRDKICAGAIGARADRLLAEIGVAIDVPSAQVFGLHVRARAGDLVTARPEPIGRVVRRRAFDARLLDRVRASPVEVRDGTRATGMRRGARCVELETSAGTLTAGAVVGADGVGSFVRRALGFSRGHYYAQVAEVDTSLRPDERAHEVLSFDVTDRTLTGYAWDFPTVVEGERVACRGVYSITRGIEVERRDAASVLGARLERQQVEPLGPVKRFAERGLSLYEPLAVERALLVGEAAGIDPVLGEGIPQAIFYGKAAAEFLATSWRAGDYRFTGYRRHMRAARIGHDLRIRAALFGFVYGATRPVAERWITHSKALADAGASYFAGEHVSRAGLARAAGDLVLCALRAAPSGPS
jgi:flavin-dependent dehydrogenase